MVNKSAVKKQKTGSKKSGKRAAPAKEEKKWNLRLYVAGQTPRSLIAFQNLKRICEEYMAGQYTIEIIDLMENPQLAKGDQILAVPTLVRRFFRSR